LALCKPCQQALHLLLAIKKVFTARKEKSARLANFPIKTSDLPMLFFRLQVFSCPGFLKICYALPYEMLAVLPADYKIHM
jgi:hypothetical protein